MTIMVGRNGDSSALLTSGTYVGVLDHIYDVGKQPPGEKFPDEDPKYKYVFGFHVAVDNKIFRLSATVTDTLHEKSRMRAVLRALRGHDLTSDEMQSGGFDISNVIGRSCFLNVSVKMSNGKMRSAIEGFSALPRGTPGLQRLPEVEPPAHVREALARRLDKPDKVSTPSAPEARAGDAPPPSQPKLQSFNNTSIADYNEEETE